MSFFEPPPPPPPQEPFTGRTPWFGPPNNVLGVTVALDLVVAEPPSANG